MDFPVDIKKLADLLTTQNKEDSCSDDDLPQAGMAKLGPANIGTRVSMSVDGPEKKPNGAVDNDDLGCIWREDEVQLSKYSNDAESDPRDRPTYDILYQQSVTSEDIFLSIGPKTPASASCEAMILNIKMEGETKSEVDCDVQKQHLDIRSPRYRLSLPLPHPVHTEISKAQWDDLTSTLKVTLFMDRELDYINF